VPFRPDLTGYSVSSYDGIPQPNPGAQGHKWAVIWQAWGYVSWILLSALFLRHTACRHIAIMAAISSKSVSFFLFLGGILCLCHAAAAQIGLSFQLGSGGSMLRHYDSGYKDQPGDYE